MQPGRAEPEPPGIFTAPHPYYHSNCYIFVKRRYSRCKIFVKDISSAGCSDASRPGCGVSSRPGCGAAEDRDRAEAFARMYAGISCHTRLRRRDRDVKSLKVDISPGKR